MTNEDVMRALECCVVDNDKDDCLGCPYNGKRHRGEMCLNHLLEDTLALLRENNAEIERLYIDLRETTRASNEEIERLIKERDEARRDVAVAERNHCESEKEIERKNHVLECYALQYGTTRDKECFLKKAREEALTELVERVKNWFSADALYNDNYIVGVVQNIAKEIKEK